MRSQNIRKVLFVGLLFLINTLNANDKVDSLTSMLEGLPDNKMKMEVLYELVNYHFSEAPHLATNYANRLRELAIELNDEKWLAKSHFNLGYLNANQGYLGKAVSHYVNAIDLYKALKRYNQLADTYYNLANLFLIAEDYVNATLYYEEALNLSTKNHHNDYLSWIYLGVGEAAFGLEDYEVAISAYLKGLNQAKKTDDQYMINFLYNTIGVLYQKQDMYNLARDNFNKSIRMVKASEEDRAIAYNNIGETYLETDKIDLAKEYFDRSITIKESLSDNTESRALTYTNFGKLYIKKGDFTQAKAYLDKAINLAKTNVIDKNAIDALDVLNEMHNLQALSEIYPSGKDMLKYENIRTAQMTLLQELNDELAPLKNQYLLQVNYEVPMLSNQLSKALSSKRIRGVLAVLAAILSVITIVFMVHYMRKVFVARRVLSELQD